MNDKSGKNIFIVKKREVLNPDVVRLEFVPEDGGPVKFKAGQYITLYFLDSSFGWQGKSYSIASTPGEAVSDGGFISIIVRKIGGFSGALHELKIGDKVKIEGPTGYFYPSPKADRLVFIAAGIGVSPFWSIIKSFKSTGELKNKKIILLYSNRTRASAVFFDELNEMAVNNDNLKVIHFLTRSDGENASAQELHRIDGEALTKYTSSPPEDEYLICGPIGFVNDMWGALKEKKIPEEKIITEAFY